MRTTRRDNKKKKKRIGTEVHVVTNSHERYRTTEAMCSSDILFCPKTTHMSPMGSPIIRIANQHI